MIPFFELAGVQPEDLGPPVATIWDEGKPIAEGLLIRASGDNFPEGCYRMIAEVEYTFQKRQTIANSSEDLVKDATLNPWNNT